MKIIFDLVERRLVPDALIRFGIRRLCGRRLRQQRKLQTPKSIDEFAIELASSPIALVPEKANEQHYEVPAAFMALALGPRMKYSCALFPHGKNIIRLE
jgi:cyclopropane-fatty-acyl-phospholipid synthase